MEKLLVCSCVVGDPYTISSTYLLDNHLDKVKEGVEKYAATVGASEILYLLPEGSKYDVANAAYGKVSPVMENPYAVAQTLEGKLPRPMIQDDFVAEYDGKEVAVITPEAAYNLVSGADCKFITINKGDAQEVKEVPYGTKLSEVVDAADAKAVLVGGIKGQFILPEKLADFEAGSDLYSNSITVYGKDSCMVVVLDKLMDQAWANTCGKCVLCREGTLQFKTILDDMPVGKSKAGDIDLIKDVAPLVRDGAYCPYGQNWPNAVLTALDLFAAEFEAHVKKKACPAGVCFQAGAIYYIKPDVCTGCTDCIDECDYTAIEGKKNFIHMIDQDMCEHCGKCVDVCEEGAIVKADGKLPKLPKKLTRVGKF